MYSRIFSHEFWTVAFVCKNGECSTKQFEYGQHKADAIRWANEQFQNLPQWADIPGPRMMIVLDQQAVKNFTLKVRDLFGD